MVTIVAVGDIMPGGILTGVDDGYVSEEVLDNLLCADIRVGTLETAVGNVPNFNADKMKRLADVIYVRDRDIKKLHRLSINIVSLANNHFFDLGVAGAEHTIHLLDDIGIKHIGAGRNLEEASRPAIEIINGKKVLFLAFCDWRNETVGWCPFATKEKFGVNPMYDDYVVHEIKKYKKQCDFVVVMPHWGNEHTWVTSNHVYALAKKMINAGADLILGSHPHRVQPVVNYNNASVAYSMGNFLFPDRLITKPRSTFYSEETLDISELPVTDAYPYVEEVTLKKWKPLARVGMIVKTVFSENGIESTYELTLMGEDGVLSLLSDKNDIESVLNKRGKMLNSKEYPLLYQIERYGNVLLRRVRILHKIIKC